MEERRSVQLLEVSLGLATQMLKMSPHKFTEQLRRAYTSDDDLVKKLVGILATYRKPSIKAPRIRRYAIELTVEMMTINRKYVKLFKDAGIARELSHVTDTTSELECCNIFFGSWVSKHQVSLDLLLDEAFKLLGRR